MAESEENLAKSSSEMDEKPMDDSGSEDADSSDVDSIESGDEDELEKTIKELDEKISDNPYLYDLHIEKIQGLRKLGELEQLRVAREKMHSIYPLTEELWIDWIQDELKVESKLDSLFDKAVDDYLSVGVWLEYVQYIIGVLSEEDGIQKIRRVFERALTAVGLHVAKGALIWEAYREFENALLIGLQPQIGSIETKEQKEQIAAQTSRITSLFKRQLAIPLVDMEATFVEYKEWCTESIDSYITQTYKQAEKKLAQLMPYEQDLINSVAPHLEAYQRYIDYELTGDEPARIQSIYERAVQENCLNPQLWMDYTKYLDTKLKVRDITLKVYERSVRNCPWCAELWVGYGRAMERHEEPHDRIKDVFERALGMGFSGGSPYLLLWTGYCDYLRRQVDLNNSKDENLEELRNTFDRALLHLAENFPLDGDPNCTLLQYWARLEAKFYQNMQKARDLWNQILQQGFGNQAASWLEYVHLERAFGDHKHCRKVLQRAINSVNDFPESVCEAYINFEREEGTLEQFDQATTRCQSQLQRVEERRAKAAEKEAQHLDHRKKQKDDRNTAKKTAKKPHQGQKLQASVIVHQRQTHPAKAVSVTLQALQELAGGAIPIGGQKRKLEDSRANTDSEGFKVPAPPGFKAKVPRVEQEGTSESSLSQQGPKAPPPGFKPRSNPPPGFKQRPTNPGSSTESHPPGIKGQDSQEATSMDYTEDEEASQSRYDSSKNHCTVFVSNLDFKIKEHQIREVFSNVGEVKDIRLVRNFKGVSKGYAYVELVDELAVQKALEKDRIQVEGRPMFVSPCEEKGTNTNKFRYSTGMEKNKLFVRGLPFTCTKEALETIFSQHGELKSVRIVTYRSGASKGLAFIEYVDESCVAQAILKTDGLQIGEHTISVAVSNPPERKAPVSQSSTFTPTLGSGKRESDRGKARTQVSLVPRSVKKAPPGGQQKPKPTPASAKSVESSSSNGESQSSTTGAKMSNADFRSMLLGKR